MEDKIIKKTDNGRYVTAERNDGLTIFLDKGKDALSEWLNVVRKHGTRLQVFAAVGMARGLQVSLNYAEKYGTKDEVDIVKSNIQNLISENPVKIKELK